MGAAMGMISGGSSLLGGLGSVVSSIKEGQAANNAAKNQSNAIDRIKAYTNEQMDPALVNKQALAADTERANARLALQAQIDPALAEQRKTSQNMLSDQLAGIGKSDSDTVAAQTAREALAGTPGMDQAKQQLIQTALAELKAGASLPPDLQAELMQAGLQRSGQVTGAAGGASGGVGSSILQQVLGSAGIQLQQQRQAQAINAVNQAQSLETQRQQILQGLFPKLQQQQIGNITATSGILQQSNNMLPQAGLSGSDVANIWLSRVGALNQLSSQKANVQAQGALATGAANAKMWGTIASAGQAGVKAGGEAYNYFNSPTPASTGGGGFGAGFGGDMVSSGVMGGA